MGFEERVILSLHKLKCHHTKNRNLMEILNKCVYLFGESQLLATVIAPAVRTPHQFTTNYLTVVTGNSSLQRAQIEGSLFF